MDVMYPCLSKNTILLYCYSALICVGMFGCNTKNREIPKAKGGLMDLRNWNINEDGPIRLIGEWDFYWQKFLASDDFQNSKQPPAKSSFTSPGIWRYQDIEGKGVEWHGFATLKLKVLLPEGFDEFMLELKDVRSAYELEVNGEPVASCGTIGTTLETSKPEFAVKRPMIATDSSELNIVIRLSEFRRDSGGMPIPIVLGTNDQIVSRTRKSVIEEWLLIGFLLFSAIYHFGLFFLRRREVVNLYFAVFCVNFIFRLLTRGEKMLFELMPDSLWWVVSKAEFLFLYLIPFLYLIYYNELFKDKIKPIILRAFYGVFGLFVLMAFVTSLEFLSKTLLAFQFLGVVSVSYIIYVTFKAYVERYEHSVLFLIGFIILLAGVINDFLYFNYIFRVVEVFNYSCIIFIFTQAYYLADRSVKAFNKEEELSNLLDDRVYERTEQLSKANVVKGKLLSIVSHDLRGPLTSLHGLVELAEQEQLERTEEKQLFKSIKRSLNSSLALLDNILLWASSQLKSNTVKVQIEPLQLNRLINESRKPFIQQASEKRVRIFREIPTDIWVKGDKSMIKSVIRNLISNAIKFSHERGNIYIKSARNENLIITSISDSGIGLTDELKKSLFDGTLVKSQPGTLNERGVGVGLLLCSDLLQQMDGEIWVNSKEERKGTIFSFSLPSA